MAIKVKPHGEMVLLRPIEEERTLASGLILTTDLNRYAQRGEVIAVGPGEYSKRLGKRLPLDVKVGDTVYYATYTHDVFTLDGEELELVREANIIAKEK